MKLKAVYLKVDSYVTRRANHTQQLLASELLSLELDMSTQSIRVDDREPGGDGLYNLPLTNVRLWKPLEESRPVKKAANQ